MKKIKRTGKTYTYQRSKFEVRGVTPEARAELGQTDLYDRLHKFFLFRLLTYIFAFILAGCMLALVFPMTLIERFKERKK